MLPAWAETLALAPVPKARSAAGQNQISVSCCLDPTSFCRTHGMEIVLGCACYIDHPHAFFLSCSSLEVP